MGARRHILLLYSVITYNTVYIIYRVSKTKTKTKDKKHPVKGLPSAGLEPPTPKLTMFLLQTFPAQLIAFRGGILIRIPVVPSSSAS